jgi:hypothetical protein
MVDENGNEIVESPVATQIVESGQVDAQPAQVDEPPDPASLSAEIERLKAVREKAEKDAEYWRRQKTEARADFFKTRGEQPRVETPAPDLTIPAAPNKEDFDDYDKFMDAKIDHATKVAQIKWNQEQERKASDTTRQDKLSTLREKIDAGPTIFPDFAEVVFDPTVPITQGVHELLAELDKPAEVAYYLAKNKAEAIAIARMNPRQAAVALGRIEARYMGTESATTVKKVTGAPAPIRPVGASQTVTPDLEKMTQKEFEAVMEKRTGRRF